jgi:cob(I)alamin adenosyltransferase
MSDWLTWVAKEGDDGLIFLGGGFRVEKNSPRVEFIGTIGELNSWIGVIVASCENEKLKSTLEVVQHDPLSISCSTNLPGGKFLLDERTHYLDEVILSLDAQSSQQKELPGGTLSAAFAHVARSVSRRAERQLLSLMDVDPEPSSHASAYLNRLSDVLFEKPGWRHQLH